MIISSLNTQFKDVLGIEMIVSQEFNKDNLPAKEDKNASDKEAKNPDSKVEENKANN